ncbi:MAG: phospho-sugar mutase [Terrimicrobiaceae bacterium]
MKPLLQRIQAAATAGDLLADSAKNIEAFLAGGPTSHDLASIQELVDAGNWAELDNRFFRTLAFGTGGLRGKSIGAVVTSAEQGEPQPLGRPQFPCTGTNAMNYYNISRATQGLVTYVKKQFIASGKAGRPAICICHDTRFFSREFAELAAEVISGMGCDAWLFEGPRSTPELSFAVRHTNSQAGINITASHNPPQYNGYKVYFDDGCQVVEPHASGIIACVNAVSSGKFEPAADPGRVIPMGAEVDDAYMDRLAALPLEPELIRSQGGFQVVFTPLHGVGGVIIKPMLARLGIQTTTVPEQDIADGRFPTVKSPNPENAEALNRAVELADRIGADLVIATDPDDDRMGIAARDTSGKMVLLTGNQTGSILCWHRVTRHFATGILNPDNASRGVVIKTFVTTDLQKAIAEKHGVSCVETLTGFKYIGEKLGKYEAAIPAGLRADYRNLSEEETRRLRLAHSKLYVFGGEESYGYSGSDFVRDKDGNSAAVMIAEAAAFARSQGLTLVGLLDRIYCEYGYYLERGESLVMDGAEGAAAIRKLVESYAQQPPTQVDGSQVSGILDFSKGGIVDSEGDAIPKEDMLMITLADGRRVAVRPSGTEPKIKYYMFARQLPPEGGNFSNDELAAIKPGVAASLNSLWNWLQADANARLA